MTTASHPATTSELRALAIATDTQLAELDGQYARLAARHDGAVSTVRDLNGERAVYRGRRRVFETPADESIATLRGKLADAQLKPWDAEKAERALARIDTLTVQITENRVAAEKLDDVRAANGYWSRFFSVQGGHIHHDISWSRCSRTATTQHGWHPELSGATEAEAVAELGPALCTHCFPSAPVEWTVGNDKPKAPRCEGAGKRPVAGTTTRQRATVYAECTVCHTRQILTLNSGIRAHAPAK